MNTKAERIKIVNDIIKVIALNGRNFFLNKKDNDMAYFLEKNGRLYCNNWGYDEPSMKAVRETAQKLGYLKPKVSAFA